MTSKVTCIFLAAAIVVLGAGSCSGFTYSSTGRAWTVRADETIHSDSIRPRRGVTLTATGSLETGSVTVSIYRDGVLEGLPLTLQYGPVNQKAEREFKEGLWSFSAFADGSARGNLYLAISDQ